MLKENFFINEPVDFKGKFFIYPPTIKKIIKEKDFKKISTVLTLSQEDIEDVLVDIIKENKFPTPFEFLLSNCYNNKEYEEIVKKAFYFFTNETITFLYEKKMILIGNIEKVLTEINSTQDLIFLNEEDFFDFQNNIRNSLGEESIEPPIENESPRVKKMKAKARYRDRIKAKQGKGLSLFGLINSICCMGIGITPLNIGEITYVAANSLLNKYQSKEKYENDIALIAAGADSKKIKPEYWIK